MLRGDRDADPAFIGAVAAFIAFLAWALVDSDRTGKQYQSYSADRCAEQKSRHSAGLSVRQIEQSPTANESGGPSRNQQEPDPDWCDLAAQESMAKSTLGMERSAWATTFLTLLGVVLLGFTLHHTRRAADASDEMAAHTALSTQAAIDAARAANITARAMIGMESPNVRAIGIEAHFSHRQIGAMMEVTFYVDRIRFRNFGRTAAFPNSLGFGWTLSDVRPQFSSYREMFVLPDSDVVEPEPTARAYSADIARNYKLNPGTYEAMFAGDIALWVHANLVFFDFLGRQREIIIRWRYMPHSKNFLLDVCIAVADEQRESDNESA
jgi:hypothetical protein